MAEKITAEIVENRISYGQYVHLKVQNPRQKSRAWETIDKVFEAKTLKEVTGWFYCTECKDIFTKDITKGTGPLLLHKKKHVDERASEEMLRNAVVIATANALKKDALNKTNETEHVTQNEQQVVHPGPSNEAMQPTNDTENAANVGQENIHASPTKDAPKSTNETDNAADQVVKYHSIRDIELPVVLANLARIVMEHGPLNEANFRAILPAPGKW